MAMHNVLRRSPELNLKAHTFSYICSFLYKVTQLESLARLKTDTIDTQEVLTHFKDAGVTADLVPPRIWSPPDQIC